MGTSDSCASSASEPAASKSAIGLVSMVSSGNVALVTYGLLVCDNDGNIVVQVGTIVCVEIPEDLVKERDDVLPDNSRQIALHALASNLYVMRAQQGILILIRVEAGEVAFISAESLGQAVSQTRIFLGEGASCARARAHSRRVEGIERPICNASTLRHVLATEVYKKLSCL